MRLIASVVVVCLIGCGTDGPEGEPGADGLDGIDGSDGADGLDGTDNHIASTIFCTGTLSGTALQFNYSGAITAAGDVFASGGVYGSVIQSGATAYYAAGQVGAASAPVFFTMDSLGGANGGWWTLGASRATSVATIIYTDVDASGGSDSWTMLPADCIINNF